MYHVLTFAQIWLCLKTEDTRSCGHFNKDNYIYENPLELLGGFSKIFRTHIYCLYLGLVWFMDLKPIFLRLVETTNRNCYRTCKGTFRSTDLHMLNCNGFLI